MEEKKEMKETKEVYEAPVAEVDEFDPTAVICTSGCETSYTPTGFIE